jgi:hypothetical protein
MLKLLLKKSIAIPSMFCFLSEISYLNLLSEFIAVALSAIMHGWHLLFSFAKVESLEFWQPCIGKYIETILSFSYITGQWLPNNWFIFLIDIKNHMLHILIGDVIIFRGYKKPSMKFWQSASF